MTTLPHWHSAPSAWPRVRLKRVARFAYGDSLAADTRTDGDALVFGSNGPVGTHGSSNMLAPAIVIGRKGSFGEVTYAADGGFAIDTTYFVDRRYTQQCLRWMFYALQTLGLNDVSKDTGVPGLSREDAYEAGLALPPVPLQRVIADFLDEKTAAIDEVIRKTERLLELLAEQRAALIHQGVTKGLDPSVPMEESGFDWYGRIPEHWRVVKIGLLARVQNGATPSRSEPDYWSPEEIPWIGSGQVNDYIVTEAREMISKAGMAAANLRMMPAGSVLVGMIGQGRTRGMSAYMAISGCINQNVAAVIPEDSRLHARYLHLVLQHAYEPLREAGRGGNQAALNCELIGDFKVPLPPPEEQTAIVSALDSQLQSLASAHAAITDQIARLREYRQALIAAAVTGQLDIASAEVPDAP